MHSAAAWIGHFSLPGALLLSACNSMSGIDNLTFTLATADVTGSGGAGTAGSGAGTAGSGADPTSGAGGGSTSSSSGAGDGGGSTSSSSGAGDGGGFPTPIGITLSGSTNTAQYGNLSGGTPYNDTCPAGQAIIGFEGSLVTAGGWHGQIQALCGTLQLSPSAPYTISVSSGATLPVQGAGGELPWVSTCPPNQLVVGFGGRAGLYFDQLSLRCAPLLVNGPPYTLSRGTITNLPSAGGTGGEPFPTTDCPGGQVAIGSRVRAGGYIDAFGLACSSPALRF
jgi:hypothetical protein